MSRWDYQPNPQEEPDDKLQTTEAYDTQAAVDRLSLPDTNTESSEATPERIQQIESMLRNAPIISASVDFAERVMAALRGQGPDNPDYRDGIGVVAGLLLSLVMIISVLGVPTYLFAFALLSGNRSQFTDEFDTVVSDFADTLADVMANPPIFALMTVSILGSVTLALFVIRFVRDVMT